MKGTGKLGLGRVRRHRFPQTSSTSSSRIKSSATCFYLTVCVVVVLLFWLLFHLLHLSGAMQDAGHKASTLYRPTRIQQPVALFQVPVPSANAPVSVISTPTDNNNNIKKENEDDQNKIISLKKIKKEKEKKKEENQKEMQIEKKEKFKKKSYSGKKSKNNDKKKKKGDPNLKVFNHQPEWGFFGEEKYIQAIPHTKIHIKWDRRIVFPPNTTVDDTLYSTPSSSSSFPAYRSGYRNISSMLSSPLFSRDTSTVPSGVVGEPRELQRANAILDTHPLVALAAAKGEAYDSLELAEVMLYIKQTPACEHIPIFLTMATVGSDIYWELVQNFVFTSVKYAVSGCSLVICVSDHACMKRCADEKFPCFNFQQPRSSNGELPSVMEQIAILKLQHIPKALAHGVDTFMLDLDVGFARDPHWLLQVFHETPVVDIFVQEDYIFIMNRTKAGWRTWFTEPLPNIGMYLVRGNNRTTRMFAIGLDSYLALQDPAEKSKPGIDQSHVLNAMRVGRGTFGLKYAFFSNYTTPLLDKIVKTSGNSVELGGQIAADLMQESQSFSMHTTCYEKGTKTMGLKATNSYWNPGYYDHLRPTLTKQLLFVSEKQLQDEVRALAWLALSTGRSLIIPNILGGEAIANMPVGPGQGERGGRYDTALGRQQRMWPGFRVTNVADELKLSVLEPGFYWRAEMNYDPAPEPTVLYFAGDTWVNDLKMKMTSKHTQNPRIILHWKEKDRSNERIDQDVITWANDSVGIFSRPFEEILTGYKELPNLKSLSKGSAISRNLAKKVTELLRLCSDVFGPHKGNGTCFAVCN